jgi:geranylgeranyl pyrophosphate synthase
MSAHPRPEAPAAREVLDRHFGRDALAAMLGTDDATALALARRATWPALAELLSRPGKAVRARLVEHAFAVARATAGAAGPPVPPILPQVLELLHAGSLVIDDVEDGATMRRGAPALHRLVGVPLAINAGNLLYFLPLALLEDLDVAPAVALAMHRRIARSLLRSHHGQGLDLALRASTLAPAEVRPAVELTSALKTGALTELACVLGAMAAGAAPLVENALADFGREVGIALQMLDDVSGIVSPRRRAKGLEDLRADRPTWAWGLLADRVDADALRRLQAAAGEVAAGNADAQPLLLRLRGELAGALAPCRARLDAAATALRGRIGAFAPVEHLVREVRALEDAYV